MGEAVEPTRESEGAFALAKRRVSTFPLRVIHFSRLLDTFLVCAVATILVIRTQLWLTNYPQLGGGGLHIAHLLWGGLGMMIAIFILVMFISPAARQVGAVIGGVGFGFFIDELGKFVTADNNYFFKPTAAIIYIIFVVLWLVIRQLERRGRFTPREYLVNAIELLKEAAIRDMDARDQQDALAFLDRADQNDPLVGRLRELIRDAPPAPARRASPVARLVRRCRRWYDRIEASRWFARLIAAFFVLWAVAMLIQVLALAVSAGLTLFADVPFDFTDGDHPLVIELARIASSALASVLVWIGVLRLRKSLLSAYRMFERAVLVSIFLTQVFAFVESQFSAVFGLIANLVLYAVLRGMIAREEELAAEAATDRQVPPQTGAGAGPDAGAGAPARPQTSAA